MPVAAMGEAIAPFSRFWLGLGAANGLIAVAVEALAAHGLKDRLSAESVGLLRTASEYQMWHGLVLLVITALARGRPTGLLRFSAIALIFGILLFSGSLYLLALTAWREFAFVTPFGGTALLIGWGLLLWQSLQADRSG
jgi:uncharacterized membrane protein YgdD (TMEM256/DUF423 family)